MAALQTTEKLRMNLAAARISECESLSALRVSWSSRAGRDEDHPNSMLGFHLIPCHKSREKAIEFLHNALTHYSLDLRRQSDLPTLSRLNLLNALANNAVLLGINFEEMCLGDCISPFNLAGPLPPGLVDHAATAPESLRPTVMQRSFIHHPWIDLVPIPAMRDNILLAIQTEMMDEEDLCRDFSDIDRCDDGDGVSAPASIWGSSWNIASWEMTPRFLKKWGWLMRGCPQALDATNFWREKRGQAKIGAVI